MMMQVSPSLYNTVKYVNRNVQYDHRISNRTTHKEQVDSLEGALDLFNPELWKTVFHEISF